MEDTSREGGRNLKPSEVYRRQQERKNSPPKTIVPFAMADQGSPRRSSPPLLARDSGSVPRNRSPNLLPKEVLERGSTPPFSSSQRERASPPFASKEGLYAASPFPQDASEYASRPPSVPPSAPQAQQGSFKTAPFQRVAPANSSPNFKSNYYGLAVEDSPPSPPASFRSVAPPMSTNDDLIERQRLAELRNELSQLRNATPIPQNSRQEELQRLRKEISRLESEKTQAITQANKEKAYFDMEIKQLNLEIKRPTGQMPVPKASTPQVEGDFMDRLRLRKEFEDNFTRTLRDLRNELEKTSLKEIDAKNRLPVGIRNMVQLSNERIDKVMEDAALIPVEERIHIETLRLLVENAKLRKLVNDYSEGLLRNSLIKTDSINTNLQGNRTGIMQGFGL